MASQDMSRMAKLLFALAERMYSKFEIYSNPAVNYHFLSFIVQLLSKLNLPWIKTKRLKLLAIFKVTLAFPFYFGNVLTEQIDRGTSHYEIGLNRPMHH